MAHASSDPSQLLRQRIADLEATLAECEQALADSRLEYHQLADNLPGLVTRDVTERADTAAAVQRSEAEKALILNTMSEMFTYYDTDLCVLWANRAAADSVGQSVEQLVGRHCYEIWHGRSQPCKDCPVLRARETGQAHSQENVTPDGRTYYLRGYPILDEAGRVAALIELTLDITERKLAEQALQESQARLALAVQGADLGMYDWNVQTGQIVVNDRYAAMLGYTVEELDLTMDKWAAMIHPDDRSREVDAAAQQLAGDHSIIETVYRVQTKEGDWRWVLDRGKVVERDAEGTPARVAGTRLDITARKQADDEKEALQAQLIQSQKMEAVGRLTAGIAHDFNNLLTVIMGFSELIKLQLTPGDPLNDPLDKVMNAGSTAANLIQQLMAFSRQQVMQPQVVDLNLVLGRMETMVRRIIGEDVALEVVRGDDLWSVTVDPTQIQQVIVNLIVNAREAMPRGGRICVETRNTTLGARQAATLADARPGNYVVMRISDTGCGMSAEVQARIFDPFFTTKLQGTGLGLPTVYGIVTQSGGCVQVESSPGQGTAFTVYLPRTTEPATAVADSPPADVRRGTETILLVEDSLEVRQYAREVLLAQGYAVLEAGYGREALQVASGAVGTIDLLLTDVVMPDMSGRAVAEHLSRNRPGLRILYMSGYTDDVLETHGALGTGVAFLQKPFTARDLLHSVQRSLDSPATPPRQADGGVTGPREGAAAGD